MILLFLILVNILLCCLVQSYNMNMNMNKISAVVFDLDGTLLDTEPLSTKAIQRCFDNRGYNVQFPGNELKKKIVGLPGLVWTSIVIKDCGLSGLLEPQQLLDDWEFNLNDISENEGIGKMKGAEELTKALYERGIPMAIATSSRRGSVEKKMKKHQEMFNRMKFVVTGDEVINGKPEPDIFLLAAERVNLLHISSSSWSNIYFFS